MANLRATRIKASDIRTVRIRFTHNLDPLISQANVVMTSNTAGVPNPTINSISIVNKIMTISVIPLVPLASYSVTLQSTDAAPFKSVNGDAFLFVDGKTNVLLFTAPEDPVNPIRDNLVSFLSNNVYNLDRGTIVRAILNQMATSMLKTRHDIGQAKNDNYLSVLIEDERKLRGPGPYDRLNEEGAYQILRVGKNRTNATIPFSISYDSFPFDLVTLQRTVVTGEQLEAATSGDGTFDKLLLTLNNGPVTIVTSVIFAYSGGSTFEYDIRSLGYQIKNPVYDSQFASTLLTLEDNQVMLSDDVFNDSEFMPLSSGDYVIINYEYKSLGRIVDEDSVAVTQVLDATREAIPALLTSFTLDHAPIVLSNDTIPSEDGVQFLDPNSETPFLTAHPAFTTEIPFRFDSLPSSIGEYSVDYATGRVFVYGASNDNEGTGNFPPAATYKYRKSFVSGLDYNYDSEASDLVASPIRDLVGEAAKISFSAEQTLVDGVDFKSKVHSESLDERIENRLLNAGSLRVLNTPVTNAFRVFNETTGEIYPITRFNDNTIFFGANSSPPSIQDKTAERAKFENILNETLIVSSEFTNGSSVRIFKINLINNKIMSITEDVIGSSFNSSVSFSRTGIFQQELYYDGQVLGVTTNTDRLSIGQYQIDYENGIVYVGVSNDQDFPLGTISYKAPVITPQNSHVIAVSEIYHSVNLNVGINKRLDYSSFSEGRIFPNVFDISDERFQGGDTTLPYIFSAGTITVTDDVKSVRHIYDAFDLNNNDNPTDFAVGTIGISGRVITVDSEGVQKMEQGLVVGAGLTIDVSFISTGIVIGDALSVIRVSDGAQLLDGYETITGNTITLAASSGASVSDEVNVVYTVVLNGASTPIVDYDRGGYYVDYTYLADEILVSYEWGDNVVDFSESNAFNRDDEYFVTYKVGALRDSLLANFGTLVDIPSLNAFDTELSREIYRDILIGALQSFTKGPTISAMELLISSVTKITPQIIEAIFEAWSLGNSILYPDAIQTSEDLQLVSGKFDQGFLPTQSGDSVTFPVSSNLRLEEGTLETWVIPEWDGLDNDATLTFSNLTKDGYALLASNIFIGATSTNPTFDDNSTFTVNRLDDNSPIGLPSAIFTQTGLFIYYDEDAKLWKILVKDSPKNTADGYTYAGLIESSGEVYDVKFIQNLGEPDDVLRSYTTKIEFEFHLNVTDLASPDGYSTTDGYISGYSFDGISFMADDQHYFFDFADEKDKNRFSLYKDGRGYINFTVWDKGGFLPNKKTRRNSYTVSADIRDWMAGEKHHVACAWRLNSKDRQDEMHLFLDGFEVPNILKYGGIPAAVSSDRFRTVKPETVVGTVPLNTIAGNDLQTTQGSDVVTSATVNFTSNGILPGNTIRIDESGFTTYTILSVSGFSLTLDSAMPATLADARFSVNPFSAIVSTNITFYTNIAVYRSSGGTEEEIPGVRADIPGYEISKNVFNQNVLTILGNAQAGDEILIRTLGLNHRRCRTTAFVWGNTQSVLKTHLPPPIHLDDVSIRKVIMPLTIIGPDNASVVGSEFQATSLSATQPTNNTEGRQLDVRVTDGNVNFSTPTEITINGTTAGGPLFETLSFTAAGTQTTTEKFLTITGVDGYTTALNTSVDGIGVEIKETYSITEPNGNNIYPVIRFAFKTQQGVSLEGSGNVIVSDDNGFFPASDIGNLLVISSPPAVANTYTIADRLDNTTVRLSTATGTPFTDGIYEIYRVSISRSGIQNGFFFLEQAGTANTPYALTEGVYEFDYSSYLEVPIDPLTQTAHVGSDFNDEKPAKAVIDELRISSRMLTDTRVGETIASTEESITTSFSALSAFRKNDTTLMLLHFDSLPLVNDSDYYTFSNREYLQSGTSVNENFGHSICLIDKGLRFDNKGTLTTNNEGSIEFWVSPKFDTYNDPEPRFYFDATSSVVEETISITSGTVKVSQRVSEILSVRLQTDINNTGEEFFAGGTIESDRQTLTLKKSLPYQQTPVKVAYTPSGLVGDRVSILKDSDGFITFNVRAGGVDNQVRQPVFWPRDTWHRIRATFKFNRQDNQDEIRLFVDGEERGVVLFGAGLLFGDGTVFGQTTVGVTNQILITNIDFTDTISQYFIGSDFHGVNTAKARFDNFRLSNKSRDAITIAGQPKDVNFSSNTDIVFPVIEDVFTTFLLDFEKLVEKVEDFAILRDEVFGIFNFTLNIIDSFGIIEGNARVEQIINDMVLALKPATSKADINIIR